MGATLNLCGLRKNGTEFPVDIMLKPIETASGAGVMSYVRDVTEQRMAQQTARSIDLQFRSVVESIGDYAIYLLDPDGHVMTWNTIRGARGEITGYAKVTRDITERKRAHDDFAQQMRNEVQV
jgi:PAS domain-containing protein